MVEYGNEFDEPIKWFYLGEDRLTHGPFDGADMQKWVNSGYFGDRLLIRTERDDQWYTLLEYIQACNGSPFLSSIYSMEQQLMENAQASETAVAAIHRATPVVSHDAAITPVPHATVLYTGAPAHHPPPGAHAFFHQQPVLTNAPLGAPPHHTMYQSYSTGMQPVMIVQPHGAVDGTGYGGITGGTTGSDGFNAYGANSYERDNPSSSSVSEMLDSEHNLNMDDLVLPQDKCVGTDDAPWLVSKVDCGTDAIGFVDETPSTTTSTQTLPITVRTTDIGRLLKELTGVPVTFLDQRRRPYGDKNDRRV